MSRLDALLYDLLEPDPRQPVRLRLEVDWGALRKAAGLTVREVAARVPIPDEPRCSEYEPDDGPKAA